MRTSGPAACAWCLEGAVAAETASDETALACLDWLETACGRSREALRAWQDTRAGDEEAVARVLEAAATRLAGARETLRTRKGAAHGR
jgi:hypothetical protein